MAKKPIGKDVRRPKTGIASSRPQPKITPSYSPALLSPRQQLFVQQYLLCLNATEAAKKAGYSKHTAAIQGSRLFNSAKVGEEIRKRQAKVAARHEVTVDRVVRELALIGFANMQDYMRVGGDGQPILDLGAVTRDQAAALQEVTVEEFVDGRSDKRAVRRTKFKLGSKKDALELLGRHLGLFAEEHNHKHEHRGVLGLLLKEIDDESRKRPLIEHEPLVPGAGVPAIAGPNDEEAA